MCLLSRSGLWLEVGGTLITRLPPGVCVCWRGLLGVWVPGPGQTSLGRQVYNKPYPANGMAVGVGHEHKAVVVGMLNGLVQVHKKEESVDDTLHRSN